MPTATNAHPGIPADLAAKGAPGVGAAPKAAPVIDPLAEMGIQKEKQKTATLLENHELDPMDSLEGIEEMDVVPAVKNETLNAFEQRHMAATIQGVTHIEVEPRVIQVLMRTKALPPEGYIVYRGVKLVIEGKLAEVEAMESRTVNDVLFPRGYGNVPLPDKVV